MTLTLEELLAETYQAIEEELTYDQLFRLSEPKRVGRSHTVRGPPLEVQAGSNSEYHFFNFKAFPSTTGLRHKGYIRFFKPPKGRGQRLSNRRAENLKVEVDCDCITGDAKILMADGSLKLMADIRAGDKVVTHKGRTRTVTMVKRRALKEDEKLYTFNVRGFPEPLKATGNHKIAVLRGNDLCQCGCGNPLQETSFTSPTHNTVSHLLGRRYLKGHYRSKGPHQVDDRSEGVMEWVPTEDLRSHEWTFYPWIESDNSQEVDPDFARLVGYYVAEGCIPSTRGRAVRLTFGSDEWDTLGADTLRICRKLGYTARRTRSNHGEWFDVVIRSKEFRDWVTENVGQYSHAKKITGQALSWTKEARKQLATGMLLGDGWVDKAGRVAYGSVSLDLVSQIQVIFSSLGIRSNISVHATHADDPNRRTMYQAKVASAYQGEVTSWLSGLRCLPSPLDKALRGQLASHRLGQLKPLRKPEPSAAREDVYDITVAEDHSFVANGMVVHNCHDYKYRWAWANKQRGAGRVGRNSLNQALNQAPVITNPGARPGLCKHLLAARNYIFGLLTSFDRDSEDDPDLPDKLEKLTRFMQKRWDDIGGEMDKARERERRYKAGRQRRNAQGPQEIAVEEPEDELPAEGASSYIRNERPIDLPPEDLDDDAEFENTEESLVVRPKLMKLTGIQEAHTVIQEMMGREPGFGGPAPSMGDSAGPGADADMGAPDLPEAPEGGGDDEALNLLRAISNDMRRLADELAPEEAEPVDASADDMLPPPDDDFDYDEGTRSRPAMPLATGA